MHGDLLRSYLAFWTVLALLTAVGGYALHELASIQGLGLQAPGFLQIEARHYGP